eukprot:m.19807 g.19807  ORF g.19807 m.19807 type:complete len:436 (-) comp5175_c0_seq2:1955-3262(-)
MSSNATNVGTAVCDFALNGTALDQLYYLFSSLFIFILIVGITLKQAGSIIARNAIHHLFNTMLKIMIGTIVYFMFGYAFSFGKSSGFFIGTSKFFLVEEDRCNFGSYFLHSLIAISACVIAGGATMPRKSIKGTVLSAIFFVGFVYPVCVHWVWGNGWLEKGDGNGAFHDFGGSGVVHVVAGASALSLTILIGPRKLRYKHGVLVEVKPHSVPFVVLGGMLAFLGMIVLNASALPSFIDDSTGQQGRKVTNAMVSTFISGAGGGLSVLAVQFLDDRMVRMANVMNGILAGAVAIAAGADEIEPWSAVLVGCVAGFLQRWGSSTMRRHILDDACDVVATHLLPGLWGLVACALFAENLGVVYAWDANSFGLLGWNLAGAFSIFAWASITTYFIFFVLKAKKLLRVDYDAETAGLDGFLYGQYAYVGLESQPQRTKL